MASGKIQTVNGLLDPTDLGITHCHEHLSMEFGCCYVPAPQTQIDKETCEFSLGTVDWINRHPYSHKSNLNLLGEEDIMVEELKEFKKNGGNCIVENSTYGLSRNMERVRYMSSESGVHIVAGTGYYIEASRKEDLTNVSIEHLAEVMVTDMVTGCDSSGIKCGVIGELGCSWPLHPNEKKVLLASAVAQKVVSCPIIIHPGRHEDAVAEIINILQESGADISKVVMSHLDRTLHTNETILEFAKMGSYLSYDLFGVETLDYQFNDKIDMPSDAERIKRVKLLKDEGYIDKLLISHDIHTKHRLTKYGGHGFSHILTNVVPKMLKRGFTQDDIDKMLIHNACKWLTF